MDESRFFRTLCAADSAISMTSAAWITRGRRFWTPRRVASARISRSSPISATSNATPGSARAARTLWIATRGARSPPIGSTRMTGPFPCWLVVMDVDVLRSPETLPRDHLFAGVVAAVSADAVRQLGLAAMRTERAGRHVKLPVGPALLAAGARMPSLGYGHGSSFLSWLGAGARRGGICRDPHSIPFTAAGAGVPILAALRAEAPAGLPAERLHGEPQNDRFADLLVDGKRAAVVEVDPAILFIQRRMALDVRILDLSTEDIEVQFEILRNVGQAPATFLARRGLDGAPDPDLLAPPVQVHLEAQGSRQGDVGRR